MKISTWNVNSVRARMPRILEWLERARPDVLCMQETKVRDEEFPREPFEEAGYRLAVFGQKTYNGVAILARAPIEGVSRGLPGEGPDDHKRVIEATVSGVRIVNLYVPNGKDVGTEAYEHKLEWLRGLRRYFDERYETTDPLVVLGDMNVAPEDRDVYDPAKLEGRIHVSEPERKALGVVRDFGFADALRMHHEEAGLYSWWDYRAGGFPRNRGLRIDVIYLTKPLADRCTDVVIDRDMRAGEKPSDHVPVTAVIEWNGGAGG